MSNSISLHKIKGLNPHLSICYKCGKDNGEIILLGNNDSLNRCNNCDIQQIGRGKCTNCEANNWSFIRNIDEEEKLPWNLCKECESEKKEHEAIVADGGIYWKCSNCNSNGVIKKTSPICQEVRRQMNIDLPNPCGVEFTSKECPICSKKEN